jgi:hypothetical protein
MLVLAGSLLVVGRLAYLDAKESERLEKLRGWTPWDVDGES